MKRKQQLAKDFAHELDRETIDAREPDTRVRATERAYIAGFEKARELALSVVVHTDEYMQSIEMAIEELGEEEE